MKSFTKTIVIINFFIGVLVCPIVTLGQIQSTGSGGDWNNASTWVGGIVPGLSDNVVVNGPVYVETGNACNDITVAAAGVLQNKNSAHRTLAVYGNILNLGTIQNNAFYLYLDIHGDIDNNGSWSNYNTFLVGASDQSISSTTNFSGYSFRSLKATGDIFANSTLRFNNTVVDFNGDTLQMNTGNDSIFINDGQLIEATILASGGAPGQVYLHFSNTAYVDEVYIEANEVVMDGVFQFIDIFQVIGNVRVEGTLQNLNGGHYTATINGNLTNNGIIRDNNFNCYLYVTGDINQNGTWSNNHTYLAGDADQNLWFTQPFTGEYLTNSNINGKVISNSTLNFNSTIIDFNYDTLMFASAADSLILAGDYFQEGVLIKEGSKTVGFLNCALSANAYFFNMAIVGDNIDLSGIFQFRNTMDFYGNVTVNGTLQNLNGGHYTATINGKLTNNGIIRDNNYNCYLYVTGDINQNGTWSNNHTYLAGDADQNLWFTQPFTGEYLTNSNNNGKVISNSTLNFNSTIIDFNYDTLMFASAADSLILAGDYFQEGVLIKEGSKTAGFLNVTLSANAYFFNVSIIGDNIDIGGVFQFKNILDFYGDVTVNGTLQNMSGGHYTATINGGLTNNGTVQDNLYNCYLYVTGDIEQNGIWTNNHTYLSGDTDQNLWFAQPFAGENLTNSNNNGKVTGNSTLIFNNTKIDFNGDTLMFTAAADSLVINSKYFQNGVIVKAGAKTAGLLNCIMSANAYFRNMDITADNIDIGGIFQFQNSMNFYGHVTVSDTMQNRNGGNYTANINGDLTNNGLIRDNNYQCYLNITGNVIQNGVWTNNTVNMTGTVDQHIECLFGNPISTTNFINTDPSSRIISDGDLLFSASKFDLNGGELVMQAANKLSALGTSGYNTWIKDGVVTGQDFELEGNANAYFNLLTFEPNVILSGEVHLYNNNVFNGYIINSGILQNRNGFSVTLNVGGRITNNGEIRNTGGNFTINCQGDVVNNGPWTNFRTILNGINDQFVFLIGHIPITGQFRFDAQALGAPYQWFYNAAILDSPDFNNESSQTLIWNVSVQQAYYGDYYCQTGGGNSRTITVGGGLLANIAVMLEGPFNTNGMSTSLNSNGYLPTSQPFSGSPWNYSGTESVISIPNADITDWVLIEYRVTPGGPENATAATMVARQAAFLLKDGSIVGMDGTNELQIDISITDNLYIAIWHRNHLGVLTSASVTQSGAAYTWDFRDNINKAYQGGQGFKDLGGGYFGMVSGDGDGNGIVQSTDETNVWKPQLNQTGYLNGDFDMSGITQSTDETGYWKPNLNTGGQVPGKASTAAYRCQVPK